MTDGSITIKTEIDTKSFDKQIEYIESRMQEIEHLIQQADLGFEVGDTQKLEKEYEQLSNRLIDLRKKKEQFNQEPLANVKDTVNFEKGISKITSKLTRMGMAMIGIRSLYGMIASSVSRITESNPELKAQIDAIKNAIDGIVLKLVQILLPVIQFVVSLVAKLLKSLFGIDIYSNKFSKNMTSANKTATKLRKQLMGFDELNILNKDGTIGALGGGDYNANVDVSGVNLEKIKTKIQNFFDKYHIPINLDYVGDMIEHPGEYIETAWKEFFLPDLITGANISSGAGLFFGKDSTITKIIKGFGRTLFGGLPGIITNIFGEDTILKFWNEIFGNHKQATTKDLKEALKSTDKMTRELAEKILNNFKGAKATVKDGMVELQLKSGEVVKMTQTEYEQLLTLLGQNTKTATSSITNILKKGINYVESELKGATITYENGMYKIQTVSGKTYNLTKEQYNQYKDTFLKGIPVMEGEAIQSAKNIENQNKTSAKNSQDAWKTAFNNIGNGAKEGANAIADKIKNALGGNETKDKAVSDTKSVLQEVTKTINAFTFPTKKVKVEPDTSNFISKIKTAINNAASSLAIAVQIAASSTGKKGAKGLLINPPKLAMGGIINRVGRGVPLASGGAIAGERGHEAVVPLTDSQQMALLGEAIGRYVNIRATVPIYVGNRQIAREVRRINAEDEFGYNGGL